MQIEKPKGYSFEERAKRDLASNKVVDPNRALSGVKILGVTIETKMGRGGPYSIRHTYIEGWHKDIPGAQLVIGKTGLETRIDRVVTGG